MVYAQLLQKPARASAAPFPAVLSVVRAGCGRVPGAARERRGCGDAGAVHAPHKEAHGRGRLHHPRCVCSLPGAPPCAVFADCCACPCQAPSPVRAGGAALQHPERAADLVCTGLLWGAQRFAWELFRSAYREVRHQGRLRARPHNMPLVRHQGRLSVRHHNMLCQVPRGASSQTPQKAPSSS